MSNRGLGSGGVSSGPHAAEPAVESDQERRSSARVSLKSGVTVRRIGGFNFHVALGNISAGGCKIELVEAADVGDSVITRFPQLEALGSRICWTNGRTTGVQFLTTIHPAVFDLLVARLPGTPAA